MPKKQQGPAPIAKKNNKDVEETNFHTVTCSPLTADYHIKLQKNFQYLRKILVNWGLSTAKGFSASPRDILVKWIDYYYQYTEEDRFDFNFAQISDLQSCYYRVTDDSIIYKSFNFFKKSRWQVLFGPKLIARLKQLSINQIKYIMGFMLLAADGIFPGKLIVDGITVYTKALSHKTIPYNQFLVYKIFKDKNLIISVGVEKRAVVGKKNIIKRYQYYSYLKFWDLLNDSKIQNFKQLNSIIQQFNRVLQQDVARKDMSQELAIDTTQWSKKLKYFFVESINPYTDAKQIFPSPYSPSEKEPYHPLIFRTVYLSNFDATTVIFDQKLKRWVSKNYWTEIQQKAYSQYQRQINEQMIKRFVDFQSAKTLVELLTKIPNFKVKLTEEEKNVIGENGNVMVIGRSGTGKTTCGILRLFAIQMLFKIRLSLYKKKYQPVIQDTRCGADDIEQTMGLHCIFLTASPVLTNQIQRYYKKITDQIKQQLQKKKKKQQQQKKMMETIQEKKQQEKQSQIDQSFQDLNETQKNEIKGRETQGKMQLEEDEAPQILEKVSSQKSSEILQQENHMNDQLKDINLKEQIDNEQFDQDNFDNMKQQFQDKMEKFKSLEDLQESDYPGFFTVKSFIMMIDGTLKKPFFIRAKDKQILDQDNKAAWHNQKKGVMMIENFYKAEFNSLQQKQQQLEKDIEEQINYSDQQELEHQYLRQIQLRQNKNKQATTKKLMEKKAKISFEVDYDYFLTYFWPNMQKKYYSHKNITPQLVWTEIYSTIKGSASAHQYPGQYMPQKVYLNESVNIFLTKQEKLEIFETFCQYQRWKNRVGGYDLMDTVNYILNFIRFRGYTGPQLHYVMIDQVQDLPHAIIYLLSKAATYGVFYSGDTAQTIAKGVGFRFCDLKNLFNKKQFEGSLALVPPVVKQLTVNFRSHNNILQLANSVVSVLEVLFPKTIDRLKKQRSNIEGPKPMILTDNDLELLFLLLCGDQNQTRDNNNGIKKPPLQFGCDQVIIVRNQEAKNNIPSMLQHALCLTIYEAKGLQFNDVILYNFFSHSQCSEKWNLLKFLKTTDIEVPLQEYQQSITKHMEEQQKQISEQIDQQSDCIVNTHDKKVSIKKIIGSNRMYMKNINDYADLCSQLKMLYTAITRPRQTLIIYDENPACRKNIQRIWDSLQVTQNINRQILQDNKANQASIFRNIATKTDSSAWKKQGLKMYSRGYFEQAKKCFEKSGDMKLFNKALANQLADQSTKLLIEVQAQRSAIKNGLFIYRNMPSQELSKKKKQLKSSQNMSLKKYKQAAAIFKDLTMFKQAGQCYFSGKQYSQAFECFKCIKMYKQAGQSLEMSGKYKQAAQYYEKDGNYLKVIQCLDLINNWELIIEKIKLFQQQMTEYEKQTLLKKYAALYLEELTYEIQFQNQEGIVGQDKKPKKQEQIEVIQQGESQQEEDQDQQESQIDEQDGQEDEHEEELIGHQKQVRIEQNKKQQDQLKIQEVTGSIYQKLQQKQSENQKKEEELQQSGSFEDLNQQAKQTTQNKIQGKEEPKQQSGLQSMAQDSFADLNSIKSSDQNSFSNLNIQYPKQLQPDIESIKSMADPQDQWLQSALSEIQRKTQSQFSILDEQQNYNPNSQIIKTKGNIFVHDEIMKKIAKVVSFINPIQTQYFKQFKGYQSLITVSQNKQVFNQNIEDRPQIAQFQQIDTQSINVILDTLESAKLYKLCLFVCNRYHLPHKAGRYLLSIGMKYSTNCQTINALNSSLLSPSIHRKTEIQKGILASIAMHTVLENVHPDFLKIKVLQSNKKTIQQNKHNLGCYFIQGLVLLGLFKKSVTMVNVEQSLALLQNYFDLETYKEIFRIKVLKMNGEQKIGFLPESPKSVEQINYAIFNLQKLLQDFCLLKQTNNISQRQYRQFNTTKKTLEFKSLEIPDYLPFTKALLKNNAIQYFDSNASRCVNILLKGQDYEIYDLVSFIFIILFKHELCERMANQLSASSFLYLYQATKLIDVAFNKFHGNNCMIIIKAIMSLFQCKLIDSCQSMSFISDGYVFLNRSSILINDFVQLQKKNKDIFAYFFEQDFNLVLVRSSQIFKSLKKKINYSFLKLYKQRSYVKQSNQLIFYEDIIEKNKQLILRQALNYQTEKLIERIEGYSQQKRNKNSTVKKQSIKKRSLLPGIDFKNHGKQQYAISIDDFNDEIDSQEQQQKEQKIQKIRDKLDKVYNMPIFDNSLQYLQNTILQIFNFKVRTHADKKVPVNSKILYASGLNHYYRQYVENLGGYNLFDAIQFKRFKRLDLYADNILSVIDDMSFIDKSRFIHEMLILLLIQYKAITEGNKFKIDLTEGDLRFLENLKVESGVFKLTSQDGKTSNFIRENVTLQTVYESCRNGQQVSYIFNYEDYYTVELEKENLEQLICEYLQLADFQENPQRLNFPAVVASYVMNMKPNVTVYEKLRKIINGNIDQWLYGKQFTSIGQTKDFSQFVEKRAYFLTQEKKKFLFHEVKVTCKGVCRETIQESQIDYEKQTKNIEVRKEAAIKISRWWKKLSKDPKINRPTSYGINQITENRYLNKLYGTKLSYTSDTRKFLVISSYLRQDLLAFYLSHIIVSSLDFHFILMSLIRISSIRQSYMKIFTRERMKGLIETDIPQLQQQIESLGSVISIWKNDEKWLLNKNIKLKKKKVFQVKWMTKQLQMSKIMKRRAGLKKVELLKKKKQAIKRLGKS